MGLFRGGPGRRDLDVVDRLAVRAFRKAGAAGRLEHDPSDPLNTAYVTDSGTFGFANLYLGARNTPRRLWRQLVAQHVGIVLSAGVGDVAFDFGDPRTLKALRARIVPEAVAAQLGASYAIPFAPGLVEVISVDSPQIVHLLGDVPLAGHDPAVLREHARRNLELEPAGESSEPIPGVTFLEGESLFTASFLLCPGFIDREVRPGPRGFVFALPNRHTLAFHVIEGASSVDPITGLARALMDMDPSSSPGGLLSTEVYYHDGTDIQQITATVDGEQGIRAEGAFLDAING